MKHGLLQANKPQEGDEKSVRPKRIKGSMQLSMFRSPYLFFVYDVENLPPLLLQALSYETSVTLPGKPLGTYKGGDANAANLLQIPYALLIGCGSGVCEVAALAESAQLLAQIDIGNSLPLQYALEVLPLEVLEPALRIAPHIHHRFNAVVSEEHDELLLGTGTGPQGIDDRFIQFSILNFEFFF